MCFIYVGSFLCSAQSTKQQRAIAKLYVSWIKYLTITVPGRKWGGGGGGVWGRGAEDKFADI